MTSSIDGNNKKEDTEDLVVGNVECCDDHDRGDVHSERPHAFALCTKCYNDHSGEESSTDVRKKPLIGLILKSPSFKRRSELMQLGMLDCDDYDENNTQERPLARRSIGFHRSRIVTETPLMEGTTIQDLYDMSGGTLGKGSYGSVVKAKDKRTGAARAIKIFYKPKIENITRLKREILIMKRLDHPNIIRLYEIYEDADHLYLSMEVCTGKELFDRIISSGHFSERMAAGVMKQIFSATTYCHQKGVMHRDLKPENILYADASARSPLRIVDWGFAAECAKNHRFTSVVGTPYYVAPEVLFGNYDLNCDIWSSGVIMFILLCGYPPFHGKNNQEIISKVKRGEFKFDPRYWKSISEDAKDLISRCLTYNPKKRISAQKALSHPWIVRHTCGESQELTIPPKIKLDLVDRFRQFQRWHRLKQLAITCVAYHITDKDIGHLIDIFSTLDSNGDGVLSITEMQQGLLSAHIKVDQDIAKLLQEIDTDGNGMIDYTEFIAATLDQRVYEQESVIRRAFRVFDLDGDGLITKDELHHVLESQLIQQNFSKDTVQSIMQEVDLNNDGFIDFGEFHRMMKAKAKKPEISSALSKAKALFQRHLETISK